ncbi:MAG: tRNA (adenosine(37)-N6)-dimethylallyltransferase MiaA, partial [Clostridia bacterium]|nr:tRNA (adenosine(37)-N6)-dimethylallyltransferase MiaA [Clostridia bacterium]
HPNNVKRVLRALEICITAGRPKSELDRESTVGESRYDACVIGLRWPRELLNERIDVRVDAMLADGLLEETRRLLDAGYLSPDTTAGQAIGYKEMLGFIRGEEPLDEAVLRLKIATHRYAKRQMTWFGAKPYVKWIDCCDGGSPKRFDEIVNIAARVFYGEEKCDIIK